MQKAVAKVVGSVMIAVHRGRAMYLAGLCEYDRTLSAIGRPSEEEKEEQEMDPDVGQQEEGEEDEDVVQKCCGPHRESGHRGTHRCRLRNAEATRGIQLWERTRRRGHTLVHV
jgi:hypothetical protein